MTRRDQKIKIVCGPQILFSAHNGGSVSVPLSDGLQATNLDILRRFLDILSKALRCLVMMAQDEDERIPFKFWDDRTKKDETLSRKDFPFHQRSIYDCWFVTVV